MYKNAHEIEIDEIKDAETVTKTFDLNLNLHPSISADETFDLLDHKTDTQYPDNKKSIDSKKKSTLSNKQMKLKKQEPESLSEETKKSTKPSIKKSNEPRQKIKKKKTHKRQQITENEANPSKSQEEEISDEKNTTVVAIKTPDSNANTSSTSIANITITPPAPRGRKLRTNSTRKIHRKKT